MDSNNSQGGSPGPQARVELLVILAFALAIYFLFSWLDAFEWLVGVIHRYERYELDEVVVLLSVLSVAFAVFAVRRWRAANKEYARRLESERLKVVLEAAGTISHEFNQPLQVIMGTGELILKDTPEGSKLHRQLTGIVESAERIADLIASLSHLTAYRTKPYLKKTKILDLGP